MHAPLSKSRDGSSCSLRFFLRFIHSFVLLSCLLCARVFAYAYCNGALIALLFFYQLYIIISHLTWYYLNHYSRLSNNDLFFIKLFFLSIIFTTTTIAIVIIVIVIIFTSFSCIRFLTFPIYLCSLSFSFSTLSRFTRERKATNGGII